MERTRIAYEMLKRILGSTPEEAVVLYGCRTLSLTLMEEHFLST
jgi:hypothetical protein